MPAEIRAREGLFLAFQYPVEIPGVSNMNFLKAAVRRNKETQRTRRSFSERLFEACKRKIGIGRIRWTARQSRSQ
jgi:Fe-S cluster assembly ATP-binding protein